MTTTRRILILLVLTLSFITLLLTLTHTHAAITSGSIQDQELTHDESASPTTPSSTSTIDDMLTAAIKQTEEDGILAGERAHAEFCVCQEHVHSRSMCAAMTSQCRDSFCNPICLNMAWSIELEVDCDAAPGWKYCQQFKSQVLEAEKAITAQFQAHICTSAHFCNRTASLVDWVETHTYGHKYPEHMLPIASCLPQLHDLHPKIAESTCKACSKIVTAKIRRGTCVPGFVPGYEVQEMSTLQERCEYVADYISTHAHSLLLELQRSLCTCLGCCDGVNSASGTKECYFPNTEKQWLKNLIEQVTTGVTEKLHREKKVEQALKQKQKKAKKQKTSYLDLKMEL